MRNSAAARKQDQSYQEDQTPLTAKPMVAPQPQSSDLFQADRRGENRPGAPDRRQRPRPTFKLRLIGIVAAALVFALVIGFCCLT